jgi:hypothetical protein
MNFAALTTIEFCVIQQTMAVEVKKEGRKKLKIIVNIIDGGE